jgi:hypothetical protein
MSDETRVLLLLEQSLDSDRNPSLSQCEGGHNSLRATFIKTLICPADALPDPPIVEILALGQNPHFPDGIFSSLKSYGPNTVTKGWASVYDQPNIDDGIFLVNYKRSDRIADIIDGTSSTILFGEACCGDW